MKPLSPTFSPARPNAAAPSGHGTTYRTIVVEGLKIFYREAGPKDGPVLLLLHGYPSSSRMFEPLFAQLSERYRLIAPDYPGFGYSDAPPADRFDYTFAHLAQIVDAFTQALGLHEYALYLQDYGGPIGFRLAQAHPERVVALVIQNAVIHEAGLSAVWEKRRAYWASRADHEPAMRAGLLSEAAGIARHVGGREPLEAFNPDAWMDEIAFLRRPGQAAIQLDLAYDYQSNVASYPAWQTYLREHRPPVLVAWGRHDPIFTLDGARAIANEAPGAELHVLEAGHFALEDHGADIAGLINDFLLRRTPGFVRGTVPAERVNTLD